MSLKVSQYKELFRSVSKNRKTIWWQGYAFEKQLNAVIAATLQKASSGSFDSKTVRKIATKQINLGTKTAGLGTEMIDYLGQGIVKDFVETFNNSQSKRTHIDKYTVEARAGKIDSSGLMFEGEIATEASSYLKQIAALLKRANFTAKSYTTQRQIWDRQIKAKVDKIVTNAFLHLGSTNQAKVYLSILSTYMPAHPALSAYMYIIIHQILQYNYKRQDCVLFMN